MAEHLLDLGNGFWNIRGNLRLVGVMNIGTQSSLVRLSSGRFVFLDSYGFGTEITRQIAELTDRGRLVEAVLNLHPFHTLHCRTIAARFPRARLYGSRRHREIIPDLDWQPVTVDSAEFAELYADDLRFSLPAGIEFISSNPRIHAGSVLAYHPASRNLHVDDTLIVLPHLVRQILRQPPVSFHPTTADALEHRPDAAEDFSDWAHRLASAWQDVRTVCAAHSGIASMREDGFGKALLAALHLIEPKLAEVTRARAGRLRSG
ncbi:hypothetical protein JJJ17_09120 [Paracoccus caeni]|uniref:Uncharacterized protein n=1 Tax=Paracoccus caeni TaxID=657651 RepID=A0A934SEW0_9RHOB|nr:hypothetical protein [Paracoccus caeni]MBK4216085.1 hypothetical protein [Paracoccus caeni]